MYLVFVAALGHSEPVKCETRAIYGATVDWLMCLWIKKGHLCYLSAFLKSAKANSMMETVLWPETSSDNFYLWYFNIAM